MISFLSSYHPPPSPHPNQRVSENQSEEWGHCCVCILRAWLKERQLFTKVAILHWFIVWWEEQSGRMAAYSREGQRPVEWCECHRGRARLLKRVAVLLYWSTTCKTYKCNFILFRGEVQGYRMSFTKEEVSVRKASLTAAHPLSGLSHGSHAVSAHLVSDTEKESQTIRRLFFIICDNSL